MLVHDSDDILFPMPASIHLISYLNIPATGAPAYVITSYARGGPELKLPSNTRDFSSYRIRCIQEGRKIARSTSSSSFCDEPEKPTSFPFRRIEFSTAARRH